MNNAKHIVIAGSTGAVGEEMLRVLEKRNFPISKLTLLASKRSAGKKQTFRGEKITIQELTKDSFKNVDIALFSAGGSISREFASSAVNAGAVVVDNSSAFRMDKNTPLVIPEINAGDIKAHNGIIANPNCSTIIMLMAVYPIHRINPVKKMVVSTYQAASGAGAVAMQELESQARNILDKKEIKPEIFPYQIAFNAFSHDSAMDMHTGYNEEEMKMVNETHKILHDDSINITATCIRIGSFRAHAESIHLELENSVDLTSIKLALEKFSGTKIIDDRSKNYFPMPMEASHQDDVLVGRLRTSISGLQTNPPRNELDLFCCGDQILKGAALNAVQIAELL